MLGGGGVCRSDTDETCADPFNNYTAPIINCDEIRLPYGRPEPGVQSNACRYTRYLTAAARDDPDGKWIVVRDCAYLNEPCDGVGDEYHCQMTHRVDGSRLEYTTCTDFDGCNSALTFGPSTLLGLLPMALSFLLYQCTL